VMSPAAQAGQALFTSKNCIACHTPATQYTNSVGGSLQDVGTLKASSGKRLGAVLTGLDVPTLKGAWNTGPWLHDGSAPTVEAAISAHTKLNLNLTAAELANLAAFVKEVE
jgi:cytochrome c peroxidase